MSSKPVSIKTILDTHKKGGKVLTLVAGKKSYQSTRFAKTTFAGGSNMFTFIQGKGPKCLRIINNLDPHKEPKEGQKPKKLYNTTQLVFDSENMDEDFFAAIDLLDREMEEFFTKTVVNNATLAEQYGCSIVYKRLQAGERASVVYTGPMQRVFSYDGADVEKHGQPLPIPVIRCTVDTRKDKNRNVQMNGHIQDFDKPYWATSGSKKVCKWSPAVDSNGNPLSWDFNAVDNSVKSNLHEFIRPGSEIKRATFFPKVTYELDTKSFTFTARCSLGLGTAVIKAADPTSKGDVEADGDDIDEDTLAILNGSKKAIGEDDDGDDDGFGLTD